MDESLAEASKRTFLSVAPLSVLSAPNSQFDGLSVLTLREPLSGSELGIVNLTSAESVYAWIAQECGIYDATSCEAPSDFQTVLTKDTERFEPTRKRSRKGSRKVYKERQTRRQFYVDYGHPGGSAHLEVFNEHGEHLGVADIDGGVLDESKKVAGRKFRP